MRCVDGIAASAALAGSLMCAICSCGTEKVCEVCVSGVVRLGDAGCVKYIEDGRIVELTARNITALLAKLDDRLSARTLQSPCRQVLVRAVDGDAERGGTDRVGAAVLWPRRRAPRSR